jgi:hypothetical protein
MVVLREEGGKGIIEGSFKPLTKTRQIHHTDSKEDLGLKMIKFGKHLCIEVIAKDVSFPRSLTSLDTNLA